MDNTRTAMHALMAEGHALRGGACPLRESEFAFVLPKTVQGALLKLIGYPQRELRSQN